MTKTAVFVELEEKVERLVNRHSQLRDENDALKREVGFLRQENQRFQSEINDVEDRVSRILSRVQVQDNPQSSASTTEQESANDSNEEFGDEFTADAQRYETPGS